MKESSEKRSGHTADDSRLIERHPPRPGETAPMIINDISHLFHGKMRSVETEGVMSQHGARCILSVLAHNEGLRQTDLVRITHMKPPTVSVTLRKMMAEDLVERCAMSGDGRAAQLYLTEKGKQYHKTIHATLREVDRLLMRGFDEQETELLCALLNRMRDNLVADLQESGLLRPLTTDETEEKTTK